MNDDKRRLAVYEDHVECGAIKTCHRSVGVYATESERERASDRERERERERREEEKVLSFASYIKSHVARHMQILNLIAH